MHAPGECEVLTGRGAADGSSENCCDTSHDTSLHNRWALSCGWEQSIKLSIKYNLLKWRLQGVNRCRWAESGPWTESKLSTVWNPKLFLSAWRWRCWYALKISLQTRVPLFYFSVVTLSMLTNVPFRYGTVFLCRHDQICSSVDVTVPTSPPSGIPPTVGNKVFALAPNFLWTSLITFSQVFRINRVR